MGSATAYHLAQDGQRVLLLEQFTVGHMRGSSHGGSRVFRYAHDASDYARVMPKTLALWRRLEHESGETLLTMTGGLYIAAEHDAFLQSAAAVLRECAQPFHTLTSAELRRQFPQFILPADWVALYDVHSGILSASRCVLTMVQQAVRHGATLREETCVQAVEALANGVAVRTRGPRGDETLYAEQVVITAGPWAQRLLRPLIAYPLPLQVTHQQVTYVAVTRPDLYAPERCPLFLFSETPYFYGFPIHEWPGHLKIGLELLNTTVDPEGPRTVDGAVVDKVRAWAAETLVGVDPEPVRVDPCLYTETPNRDFIVDRHPDHPQIVIGAGYSGRGFKFAISMGRILADLTQSPPGVYNSDFWLPRYAVTRFAKSNG
jgi:monomeric sarcosine oxidase